MDREKPSLSPDFMAKTIRIFKEIANKRDREFYGELYKEDEEQASSWVEFSTDQSWRADRLSTKVRMAHEWLKDHPSTGNVIELPENFWR